MPQYRKDFFNQLKEALQKEDIDLELVYGKNKNSDSLKKDEVDIDWATYIPNKTFHIGKTEFIWQPCLKYLKDKDLVIVESANKLLINYYLMFSRHFAKYKLAFWGHGRNLQENYNSLRNRFKYLFINKCDWWFGYSKGTKKFLLANGFPENKITVVQNAIDTLSLRKYYAGIPESELNDLREKLRLNNSKTGIYCGAMYPEKNFDFIIETCKRVKKEIPEFSMIFIGSGIESDKILEASKSYDWIHYAGSKFGAERVKYFKASLIQLMPYYVGLGVVDSFALETPIITTSNPFHGPEIEYLENGKNGFVTDDNIEAYSQTVIDILKTGKYEELISGCRLSAKLYTVETMVENFKNGILSCLGNQQIRS